MYIFIYVRLHLRCTIMQCTLYSLQPPFTLYIHWYINLCLTCSCTDIIYIFLLGIHCVEPSVIGFRTQGYILYMELGRSNDTLYMELGRSKDSLYMELGRSKESSQMKLGRSKDSL